MMVFFLLPLAVKGQKDTLTVGDKMEIGEVVVSARRTPVVYSRLSRIVTTAGEEEIERLPANSIHGVLDHLSGVDLRQRGPLGVQADLSIRGSSFDQNLILLNGIDITDPQTGHFALNLPVNLSDVKEIEVLKGPGSRVFGPNAFGGAVNIITTPADSNRLKVELLGGSHGLYRAGGMSSFSIGESRHHLSFSRSASDGYMENTDFSIYQFYYHGQVDIGQDRLNIQAGHKNKEYGAQNFYTPEYSHQYEQARTSLVSVSMELGERVEFRPALYWRRHRDRFELFREGENWYQRENGYWVRGARDTAKYKEGVYAPWNYYSGHNYHMTDVYGAKMSSSFHSMLGKTALGFDLRSEHIWSNVLGEAMEDTIPAVGEPQGYYDKQYHRTLINLFFEHNIYIQRFSLSAGVLVSRSNEHSPGWNLYPGVDLSYRLTRQLSAYGSFNQSLRMPTFTDLFYEGPSNVGNPHLKPEKIQAYEGGFKLHSKSISAHASFFYHDANDLIAWTRQEGETGQIKWKARNLTRLINQGLELSATIRLDALTGTGLVFDRVAIHYTNMKQRKITGDYESKYSLNYPDEKLNIRLSGKTDGFHFSLVSAYHDRAGKYLKYDFSLQQYTREVVFKPYWMFDAKLGYRWKRWKAHLEVTNLFDRRYSDIGNIRMPGRWIKVGITREIKLGEP